MNINGKLPFYTFEIYYIVAKKFLVLKSQIEKSESPSKIRNEIPQIMLQTTLISQTRIIRDGKGEK